LVELRQEARQVTLEDDQGRGNPHLRRFDRGGGHRVPEDRPRSRSLQPMVRLDARGGQQPLGAIANQASEVLEHLSVQGQSIRHRDDADLRRLERDDAFEVHDLDQLAVSGRPPGHPSGGTFLADPRLEDASMDLQYDPGVSGYQPAGHRPRGPDDVETLKPQVEVISDRTERGMEPGDPRDGGAITVIQYLREAAASELTENVGGGLHRQAEPARDGPELGDFAGRTFVKEQQLRYSAAAT